MAPSSCVSFGEYQSQWEGSQDKYILQVAYLFCTFALLVSPMRFMLDGENPSAFFMAALVCRCAVCEVAHRLRVAAPSRFAGLEVFFPYEFIYKEQYTYMKELKVRFNGTYYVWKAVSGHVPCKFARPANPGSLACL